MLDDLRYAFRGMRRSPGFTAVAVLMIALGTGANAAMFSVIDAVLLRSPFLDPDRIAMARSVRPGTSGTAAFSAAQVRSLLDASGVFESIGAMGGGGRPVLRGLGEPRPMNVECVTAGMFKTLGTEPIAGRTFAADEDRPGGPSVVVLSYQFWHREMGADAGALGRSVTLNGVPTTIIGIMPRAFGGPYSRNNNDGWLPLGPAMNGESRVGCVARGAGWLWVRLRPGVSRDAAAEQATAAAGIDRLPDFSGRTGARLTLVPVTEQTIGDLRTPLVSLLGSVGLVLLIACANVANLQLERIFGRRRELAVRMAIGASRARVVRQTLLETLLLSVLGGACGLLAASWTLSLIVGLLPANIPHVIAIRMNGFVLAITLAIACAAGLSVGLLPALQSSSPRLIDDLRVSSGTTRRSRTLSRASLVVAQIALSLILLVGAGLLIRTFLTLRPASPGFTTKDKLIAAVRLQGPRAASPATFFDPLVERLRAVPGVRGVTASTYLPVSGNVGIATIVRAGSPMEVFSGIVRPDYFGEMEIPVLRGRPFDARDTAGSQPVAIINEELLRRLGSAAGPGSSLVVTGIDRGKAERLIIGVIRDTRSSGADTRARPELYVPFTQMPYPNLNLIVRTAAPADPRVRAAIRDAVAAVDETQVVDRIVPLAEMLDARVQTWRFAAWLLGTFAAMALLLASVGLAASIAWSVTQRTREIGVRMALGAGTGRVTRMVMRQGSMLAGCGIALGLAGAAATTRLLQSWLYGVTPLDIPTFAWSAAGMFLIALAAAYLPARRAARVDPLVALRTE